MIDVSMGNRTAAEGVRRAMSIATAQRRESSILKGKRIVTCEDEAMTQLAMGRALRLAGGHVVGMAVTGEQAVDITLRERPDIVLMDILLPGIDGIEAARQIQRVYNPCLIVVSAYSDEDHRALAEEIGAAAYIVKPVTGDELIRALERALHDYES